MSRLRRVLLAALLGALTAAGLIFVTLGMPYLPMICSRPMESIYLLPADPFIISTNYYPNSFKISSTIQNIS